MLKMTAFSFCYFSSSDTLSEKSFLIFSLPSLSCEHWGGLETDSSGPPPPSSPLTLRCLASEKQEYWKSLLTTLQVMVGHLQFQGMENNSKEKNQESLLDSPDSGLPPSPSPPFYSLSPGIAENKAVDKNSCAEILDHGPGRDGQEGRVIPYVFLNSCASEIRPRMYPVFFGESIEVNPVPAQEIRCNSEIKYSSEKHYRDDIFYHPRPTITTYRESVTVAPNCTWRNYKSQLLFEPRQKPLRFQSTTIIFPKQAKNLYRTTLNYQLGCAKRWFASSVQLALCEDNETYLMHPENLS